MIDFSNKEIIKKYNEGREVLLIGLFQSILSLLNCNYKYKYEKNLKSITANIVNRLTLREEKRPDPRKKNNQLAVKIKEICEYKMLKEAASFIILFDVFSGCFSEKESKLRIKKARNLGGSGLENILKEFKSNQKNPQKKKTEKIRDFALTMAGTLYQISQINIMEDLDFHK